MRNIEKEKMHFKYIFDFQENKCKYLLFVEEIHTHFHIYVIFLSIVQ